MEFTIAFVNLCLFGAIQAQTVLLQCAVQGDGDYDIVKTADRTSTSCTAAGGSLGSTPGGGRAGGISCCTTPISGKDAFYAKCRTYTDFPIGVPQPC
ncbi:hypothetical protein CI238_11849 [Colletotrichum incanum]|uniref:Uncharacterized protein n=1 Tax=Colletotrichum incanum TaxID=1573173 RepID=A0A166N1R9_COLIC|nr:hypothetical protein CI238_11849 [Colletotrichum incanum]